MNYTQEMAYEGKKRENLKINIQGLDFFLQIHCDKDKATVPTGPAVSYELRNRHKLANV